MTVDEYLLLEPAKGSFKFRKRWQTGIQIGLNGEEVRSALFTWLRRSITAKYFAKTHAELNYLKRILFKNLHLVWGIPFWQDETTLTSQASSGQKILDVGSTLHRNFEAGALCISFQSITSYEVGQVDSFTADQITLVDNLATTWPAGTKIYPLLKGKIEAQQEIDLIDPAKGGIVIDAHEEFDDGVARSVPSIASFPVYLTLPVFNLEPKYARLKQILYRPYSYLGFLGKSYSFTHYDEAVLSFEGEYVLLDREAIHDYLDFFDYHKGRWGEFWFPSHQRDIVISTPFGAGDTTFTIEPIEYSDYWTGKNASRYIAFRWPDETVIYRKIVGDSGDTITIDSALGVASSNPSEIVISFLLLGRFDMDEAEVDYRLIEIGSTIVRFHSLPQETPA